MNNEVSKIQIETGTYNIKDTTARTQASQVASDLETTTETLQTNITNNTNAIEQTNTNLNNAVTELDNRIDNLENKKYIVIGDSYAEGTSAGGVVTYSWAYQIKDKLNIPNDKFILRTRGGCCFGNTENNYNSLLQALSSDNEVTDIIICGGYNDIGFSRTAILNGMGDVRTTINSKFPNAKVYVGFIGGTTNSLHGSIMLKTHEYNIGCLNNKFIYLNNLHYTLYNAIYLSSDGIHPTQEGQNVIADTIYQSLLSSYNYLKFTDINIDTGDSNGNWVSGTWSLHLYQNNSNSVLSNYSAVKFLNSNQEVNCNHNGSLVIGKISVRDGIIGSNYYYNCYIPIGIVIVHDSTGYYEVNAQLTVDQNGYLILKFMSIISDDHIAYHNFTAISQIQFPLFSGFYITDLL